MTAYYNEIDPYCCKVLRRQIELGRLPKGFVDERDIREVRGEDLREFGQIHLFAGIGGFPYGFKLAGMPDDFSIVTAGFPCQDISNAGKRAGIGGERSGLWREGWRIISELRRRYAVLENVAALLGRGIGRVCGDLAAIGYDAEWNVISAADAGAPHLRERVWIVAYPASERCGEAREYCKRSSQWIAGSREVSDALRNGFGTSQLREFRAVHGGQQAGAKHPAEAGRRGALGELADADQFNAQGIVARSNDAHIRQEQGERSTGLRDRGWRLGEWPAEPNVGRVAHGVSKRVDRLRGLGNAIVPQIAQWIGERIMEAN